MSTMKTKMKATLSVKKSNKKRRQFEKDLKALIRKHKLKRS
jgi:hypothetical protein